MAGAPPREAAGAMTPSRMRRHRLLWSRLHRWLALSLGAPLAIVALLGVALTIAKPLDRLTNPQLFRAQSIGPLADDRFEQARQTLVAEYGRDTTLTLRPPREPVDTLWVMVSGPWNGTVYLDPQSGRELGRRGEREGLYNLLFGLHSSLLMNDGGKAALAVMALAYLVLLATGLVLWWPSDWSRAWRVELRRNTPRALSDLHRVAGSLLGLAVAVSVASGAYMAWRPLSAAVTTLAGGAVLRPPVVSAAAVTPGAVLDHGVQRAQALFAGAKVGYVQVPGSGSKPVRVRLKLPDDPHPSGLTSVWLHPASGELLRVDRWSQLDPGTRSYTWIYPLHTGDLGGPPHIVLNALLGCALVGFAGSGVWLWWLRRPARANARSLNGRAAPLNELEPPKSS